jgi:hypothetical protein
MLAGNATQHKNVKKNLWFLSRKFSHKNLQVKLKLYDLSKMVIKLKYKWKVSRK